jgi:Flp pilus assembly protein TadD
MGGLATTYFMRKQYDQALAWSEKALLENPSNMQALRAKVMSAAKLGDFERARSAAEKLWTLYPRNFERIEKMMQRQEDVQERADALRLAGIPA